MKELVSGGTERGREELGAQRGRGIFISSLNIDSQYTVSIYTNSI